VDFVVNGRGRLTSAGSVSYTYDALGQRAGLAQGATATRFVHDPGSRLPRVLAAITGSTTTEYVYGLGLLHEEAGGQVRYYHFDRRGSTIALTDTAGGVQGRAYYGDWGEDAGSTGDMAVRFRFHGELGVQTDPNGLLLMGARYYHPTLRRFISPDPVDFWGGVNWYAFADNNPISNSDPLGLWVESGHAPLTSHTISKVGGFTPQDFQTMMEGNSYVDRVTNHIGDKPNAEHNMPGAERIANEGIAYKIKRAVQLEMEGKHNEAMWILGNGMHTAQDINHTMSPDPSLVQHAWGTRLGFGYDPDDPAQNMAAWAQARRESVEYLQLFKTHLEAARQGKPLRVGWKGVFK
jgi:RHS repeat-associated protein